jgi:hypothetical protein
MIKLAFAATVASGLLGSFVQPAFGNAPKCTNLPPSNLQIYSIDLPEAEEEATPTALLTRTVDNNDVAARHTMALFTRNVVGQVTIRHREVPQEGGMICNAPETVKMGFGSTSRKLIVAESVVGNSCVRRALREHEKAHSVAFNAVLDRFIKDNETSLRDGMVALKQMPADTFEQATARWNHGLQLILEKAKVPLLTDLSETNIAVDTPEVLKALESACGGTLKRLEDRYSYH